MGLPTAAATNAMTLDDFETHAAKGGVAFASGMLSRLGAASGVSWLDEQALVMIADEVLGGWGRGTSSCCSFQPKCDVTRMLS